MNKSLYYIECTANSDLEFKTAWKDEQFTKFHKGDVVYFTPKAASNEMYVGYGKDKNPYSGWSSSYLPFTRQKRFAKKWQIKEYADRNAEYINEKGQFNAVVKEIKITYTEEEV